MKYAVRLFGVPLLLALAVLILWGTQCQSTDATGSSENIGTNSETVPGPGDKTDYLALWTEVEKFQEKGLPQSALKTVERIYKKAKEQKHAAQLVKALLHYMRYLQEVEEETFVKVQERLNQELKESEFPVTPLLHSMLAEQYWNYYQQNRYQLLRRSTTSADVKENDIRTWDARRIIETVVKHYQQSLENANQSKTTRINIYDDILYSYQEGRNYRPTLYDFLAHRAVDFFINSEAGITQPSYRFYLDNPAYLADTRTFAQLDITTKDPLSFNFFGLKILQNLVLFHLEDDNPQALVDVDLKRLRFIYREGVISNKDLIYEKALQQMIKLYGQHPVTAEIYFELAQLYNTQGDQYNPLISDQYKWHKKRAFDLCQEAIGKYPGSTGAGLCQNLLYQIKEKFLHLNLETVTTSKQPWRTLLKYKNINQVFFKIIRTNQDEQEQFRQLNTDDMLAKLLSKRVEKSWNINVLDDNDFQEHSTELKIDGLDWGEYMLVASFNKDFDFKTSGVTFGYFNVSNISFFDRKRDDTGWEFYLVDRDSGHPLANAEIHVWFRIYNQFQRRYVLKPGKTFKGNQAGYVNIPFGSIPENYFQLEFIHGQDHLFSNENYYLYQPYNAPQQTTQCFFFTDRAIYRPGQTVYFKGIMLEVFRLDGEKTRLLPNYNTEAILLDVNHQQVHRLPFKTNEYGTFSGSFTLPTGQLNGNMQIKNNCGQVYFSVEEYKRPKFRVEFPPMNETFRLNEKVTVKGEAKAYAGYMIDNAEVKYRVVRQVFYPYMWYFSYRWGGYNPPSPSMEIKNGVTKTGADGSFEITFDAIPDLSISKDFQPAFNYTVVAHVTDMNGETRSASKNIAIGDTALILSAYPPELLDKNSGKTTIYLNSTTLSGDFIEAKGTITVYKLETPNRFFRDRLWERPDRFTMDKKEYYALFPYDIYEDEVALYKWKKEKQVFSGSFDTGEIKSITFNTLNSWETGKYILEMDAKDRYGNPVKEVKYFTLYSANANTVPFPLLHWFAIPRETVEPGENVEILIGSADKNVRALYEVEYRSKIIQSEWLTLDNEQKKITIPILEKHRGNIAVHITFIRHNRMINYSQNITVPWSNKKLDISFETFRNKLLPGEKEEWRLKIKGPKGDQATAEMVASLYDASLDSFRVNTWYFQIFPSHYPQNTWTSNPFFYITGTNNFGIFREYFYVNQKNYDMLNWFGFYLNNERRLRSMGYVQQAESGAPPPAPAPGVQKLQGGVMKKEGVALEESIAVKGKFADDDVADKKTASGKDRRKNGDSEPDTSTSKSDAEPVKARTNFNETAFFYPDLKTTPQGDIIISFTVPEALTKWKMMGFAHSKALEYGFVANELVTQKDLMVVPNTPRFFREGDTLVYTAKITNLSDKQLSGTAELKLFDAVSMQPVDNRFKIAPASQSFTVLKGQSTLVKWQMSIPDDLDAVTYRVTARAGSFSDGEEQAVPILKNRMLVTESLPLPVRANQTKSFTFDKLINSSLSTTLKHHRVTLEFTSNPVWYAVQALPYLMEYPHECMEQVFSRFYANSIASYIVNRQPKIKQVFDTWKKARENNDSANVNALLSNLQKNQELKSALLEETPWVLNGQNEEERKHRIALLFDLNMMTHQLTSALNKLKQGQLSSGGWPWFKGMQESRYITQHIICGFAHLGVLKVIDPRQNPDVWQMTSRAIPYLDSQITEDYRWLLKNKVDLDQNNLGYVQVHYLYARSYFQDIPMDNRDLEAFNYYKNQVKKYWPDFHTSKYAQGMMALIMKRYKDMETATAIMNSIKEHALYSEEMGMYWKTSYGYYWYEAPIETHALLIEAFDEVLNDAQSVDGLKTWLLKQKQTQDWRTTKATADACYALLLKGDNWLSENKEPSITLGKQNPIPVEPGKTGGDGEVIQAEAGTGYFKTSWSGDSISPDMGYVTIKNNNAIVAWGSLYWQYFENLDKITPAETPLSIKKKLFIEKPSDTGPILVPINEKQQVKIGDRVKVRIELRVDRNMEYVHMKDMRASSFEPEDVISQYKWQDGLGYYQSTKDASTNFFFDYIPKGTYVFEYALRVTHDGDFSNGITSIQCMYAPEFTSHSEGVRVKIGN